MSNETTMTFGEYGSRYETHGQGRTMEIAKHVRADIKYAQKLPATDPMHLPSKGFKVSVRTELYAGGSSLNVHVTEYAGQFINMGYALLQATGLNDHRMDRTPELTIEAARVVRVLERICDMYNFDKSDIQTDYFHVNFYSHVGFHWELRRDSMKALLASLAVTTLAPDIKVTIGAGQRETAMAQINAESTGYETVSAERMALDRMFRSEAERADSQIRGAA